MPDKLPWGTLGFGVSLSPTAIVPVHVTLTKRSPSDPLITMRKSGISPESREAIRTGVLAALVNFEKLFTALAGVYNYRLRNHGGLWHLLAGYHFCVDIQGMDVEGNSLGYTVALATASLLLGVPTKQKTGTTGAVRPCLCLVQLFDNRFIHFVNHVGGAIITEGLSIDVTVVVVNRMPCR